MKNSKLFVLCSVILIFTILLASCGNSGAGYDSMYLKSKSDNGGNYYEAEMYYDNADYDYGGYVYEMDSPPADESGYTFAKLAESSDGGSTVSTLPADRKIIRDAYVIMEVENVEKSYDNIYALMSNLGGYEAKREMQSDSSRYYDSRGYSSTPIVSATLKIPAGKLDAFLAGLKGEGEVITSNISSADITDQYFDTQTRLETLNQTLENYRRFLENAVDVDEQLRVTRYINDITAEIEQLKGSIKRWDSLVEYSTVTLQLYRPYEAPIPEPEVREINWDSLTLDDMGWYISSGFLGVCNTIFSVLQWIAISIIVISPIAVPIAVILFVWLYVSKKNKKKREQEQNNNNPAVK